MKRFLYALSLVGVLGVLPAPAPADATVAVGCLSEAIESCNADFAGESDRMAAIRGWCYMIRWSWCEVFDE